MIVISILPQAGSGSNDYREGARCHTPNFTTFCVQHFFILKSWRRGNLLISFIIHASFNCFLSISWYNGLMLLNCQEEGAHHLVLLSRLVHLSMIVSIVMLKKCFFIYKACFELTVFLSRGSEDLRYDIFTKITTIISQHKKFTQWIFGTISIKDFIVGNRFVLHAACWKNDI